MVPSAPAAHLTGEAFLDTGLELVVGVGVARVSWKVQLLNLSQGKLVEAIGGFVRMHIK